MEIKGSRQRNKKTSDKKCIFLTLIHCRARTPFGILIKNTPKKHCERKSVKNPKRFFPDFKQQFFSLCVRIRSLL